MFILDYPLTDIGSIHVVANVAFVNLSMVAIFPFKIMVVKLFEHGEESVERHAVYEE